MKAAEFADRAREAEKGRLSSSFKILDESLSLPRRFGQSSVNFSAYWDGERPRVSLGTPLQLHEFSPSGLRWLAEMIDLFEAWERGSVEWPAGDAS